MVRIGKIPVRLLGVYLSWFQGVDLKKLAPKATYSRWRKDLLKFGIDIKKAPAKDAELMEVA